MILVERFDIADGKPTSGAQVSQFSVVIQIDPKLHRVICAGCSFRTEFGNLDELAAALLVTRRIYKDARLAEAACPVCQSKSLKLQLKSVASPSAGLHRIRHVGCEQAWGPDADRRSTPSISREGKGSPFGACSHSRPMGEPAGCSSGTHAGSLDCRVKRRFQPVQKRQGAARGTP